MRPEMRSNTAVFCCYLLLLLQMHSSHVYGIDTRHHQTSTNKSERMQSIEEEINGKKSWKAIRAPF